MVTTRAYPIDALGNPMPRLPRKKKDQASNPAESPWSGAPTPLQSTVDSAASSAPNLSAMPRNILRQSGVNPVGGVADRRPDLQRADARADIRNQVSGQVQRFKEQLTPDQLRGGRTWVDEAQSQDAQQRDPGGAMAGAFSDRAETQGRIGLVRGINDGSALRRNPSEVGLTAEQFRGMGGQPDYSGTLPRGLRRSGAGFGADTSTGTSYGLSSGPINQNYAQGAETFQPLPQMDQAQAQQQMEQAQRAIGPAPSQLSLRRRFAQERPEDLARIQENNQNRQDVSDFRAQANPLAQGQMRLQRQPYPGETPETYATRQAIIANEIGQGGFGRFQQQRRAQEDQARLAERQQDFQNRVLVTQQVSQLDAQLAPMRAQLAELVARGEQGDLQAATQAQALSDQMDGLGNQRGQLLAILNQDAAPQHDSGAQQTTMVEATPAPTNPQESPNPRLPGESDAAYAARQQRESVVGAVSSIPGLLRRGSTFVNDTMEGWTGIPRPGSTSMIFSIAMRENLRAKGMEPTPENMQRVQQEFEAWQQRNGTGDTVNDLREWNRASSQFAGLRMPALAADGTANGNQR